MAPQSPCAPPPTLQCKQAIDHDSSNHLMEKKGLEHGAVHCKLILFCGGEIEKANL
jgi:hypothetical protein